MEVSALVEQQGETINNIERLVEDAQHRVHEGGVELVKAHTYQKKARKKKLVCGAILLVVIAIIIVIIVITYGGTTETT